MEVCDKSNFGENGNGVAGFLTDLLVVLNAGSP
jgi:hypothetical protein